MAGRLHQFLFCGVLLAGITAAGLDHLRSWVAKTDLPPLIVATGAEVVDRNGELLRPYQVADGRWRLAVKIGDVDPRFIDMLIAYEDKRFLSHSGVDLRAMSRAAVQAAWHGRVVSGGSTLTMQVARLLENSGTGRWAGKFRQIRVALAMEQRLDKREILSLYLQLAPYGGNLEGIRAASLAYFNKPPRRLTVAESALLVALPQSPETRRPDRFAMAAEQGRNRVLSRMLVRDILDMDTALAAKTESITAKKHPFPMVAPHLADRQIAEFPLMSEHRLSLDAGLQRDLERLATSVMAGKDASLSMAVMVMDHHTGAVVTSIGSPAYEQGLGRGFIDMTTALRSPGSTLKPLIYGLAFDRGMAHPETLIQDRPTAFGSYLPQNFDKKFRGTVRVRQALQMSLNIPVVAILDRLGPARFMQLLKNGGANPVVPGDRAGLAVGLGGLGMTLVDLMRLYGALAQGGTTVDLHYRADHNKPQPNRLISPESAWMVGDVLKDVTRPASASDREIAHKTGTSYGHRDAWAIGYDGQYVVGVWMGRPDGTPVPGAFGGDLAAPVFFQVFDHLPVNPLPAPPPATLILGNADLPIPLQWFRPRDGGFAQAQPAPSIAFPPDGAFLDLAGGDLVVKIRDGQAPFTWLLNGKPIYADRHERQIQIATPELGFTSLLVIDGIGQTANTSFRLQ